MVAPINNAKYWLGKKRPQETIEKMRKSLIEKPSKGRL